MKISFRQIKKSVFLMVIGIIIGFSIPQTTIAEIKKQATKKSMDMVAFYWVLFVVGGLIALTLTYVSWRKYRGEKQKRQLKPKDKTVD